MKLALEELRRNKVQTTVFVGFFVLLLGISFVVAYVGRFDPQPDFLNFATGMSVVETNLVWSTMAMSVDWLGQMIFILGIVIGAFNRSYLGAGLTRRQILARSYSYRLLMLGLTAAIVGGLWGLAFVIGHPVVNGVNAATVALIFVKYVSSYLAGYAIVSLFLRFRPWWVVAGIALIILLAFVGAITLPHTDIDFIHITIDLGSGIHVGQSGQTANGATAILTNAYLTMALSIALSFVIGAWATLTMPMRRS